MIDLTAAWLRRQAGWQPLMESAFCGGGETATWLRPARRY